MKTGYFKKFATTAVLAPALLIGTLPASAQSYGRDDNRSRNQHQPQQYDNRNRDQYQPQQYDNRDYNRGRDNDRRDYDRDRDYRGGGYGYYSQPAGYVTYTPAYSNGYYVHDNGIGPGKGAAIGAVSGAVLGALIGGGKGAVIGGAAGAGVGAIAGQAAQDNRHYR